MDNYYIDSFALNFSRPVEVREEGEGGLPSGVSHLGSHRLVAKKVRKLLVLG